MEGNIILDVFLYGVSGCEKLAEFSFLFLVGLIAIVDGGGELLWCGFVF